ncbi:MAG: O-antigen ligase family protein [Syntrophales bacterium]
MLAGGIAGTQTTIYGAALFLLLLYGRYWRYLVKTRLNFLTSCIFLCLFIPLIPLFSHDGKTLHASLLELAKYTALHMVILLGISLPLTPLSRARKAWILHITILLFLIIGCIWSITHGYKDPRMKGFLPNPNTFALTAMMLLFLTDMESPRSLTRRASHLVVITFLFLSRTSGAFIGYLAGIIHLNLFVKKRRLLNKILVLVISVPLAIVLFSAIPPEEFKVIETTKEKIELVEKNYSRVLSGHEINFYSMIERRGADYTSGLWRLYQWNLIIRLLFHSSLEKVLFGYGVGTTDIFFRQKAHNDYVRLLFETGMIGLILNLTVWIVLYRRMAPKYRWVVVMIAVYCFTENNYDHFPAMSLLAFFMISAGKPNHAEKAKRESIEMRHPQTAGIVSLSKKRVPVQPPAGKVAP